jgi:lysophospholipase L1-like esterase
MLTDLCLAAIPLIVALTLQSQTMPDPNVVVNGGFESGLTGWTPSGHVDIETLSPLAGAASLKLGPGKGAVSQRYEVSGLRIIEFGAKAKFASLKSSTGVRVTCYDGHGRILMDLRQGFDALKATDPKGDGAGIYFKTHAFTKSIVVSIEKTSSDPGTVLADSVELHDFDHGRKEHVPLCDLAEYMAPVWHGAKVVDESVLLLSTGGAAPTGKLLFAPRRILSVKGSSLETTYAEGRDFSVDGDRIVGAPGSKIPTMKDSDFPKGEYPWMSLIGKHVVVTYEHDDSWTGPIQPFEGDRLPHTIRKLERRRPLTIVALGDSITLGINVSGYREEPPYMPVWPDLFAWQLKKTFASGRIKLFNVALGGMTSQWGRDNAKDAVASLNPDLVLIAFGMNDFWSISPDEFRANIQATMQTVRLRRPNAEFILVSSIRFDPAYTSEAVYVGHITSYREVLKSLVGPGVALLDLMSLSEYLYKAKGAKDLLADPMHPDDFFARLFAQFLVQMVTPPKIRQTR